jgi:hypothetical protein
LLNVALDLSAHHKGAALAFPRSQLATQ